MKDKKVCFLELMSELNAVRHSIPERNMVMRATCSWKWHNQDRTNFSSCGWIDNAQMWEDVERIFDLGKPLVANKEMDQLSIVFTLARKSSERKKSDVVTSTTIH